MDLAELKFKVNTDELALAAKKIEALGTAVSDLNAIQKQSATINREEAKASKDKVQSDTAQVQAKNKLTEATENSTKASKAAVSETDRLNKLTTNLENTFKDLSKGFTRGESSVLNLARSFGASAEGIERVKAELAKIGTLIKDPFDAAIGSVRSINQEFDKVTNRTNLAAQGIVLTTKQLSEYSRVATEISAKILSAGLDPTSGKGLADFTKGLERVQQKYLGIAESVNIANNAEKERQRIAKEAQGPTSGSMDQAVGLYYKEQARAMRESSSAAAYLEKEMKRVDFVLNEVNAELQLSTSNRLLKFEESLKRTGVTGTQAASQIESYRKSLQKIDETRAFKRQTDDLKVYQDKVNYVTRAVGPQLTDIFSGLLTGQQSLYTIAVQQGGQLADQFSLAGIEANKMGGILASALPNMYTNIANIGKAFGQMAVGGITQLGAKFIEVAAASIPFSDGLQGLRNRMIAMDGVANSSSSTLRAFDAALKGASIFAGALAVALAGVSIAVVLETYKIIRAESDLSKALAMSGAAMNLTKEQAVGYAESLTTAGTTTREVMNIISEMAKTGVIGSESIAMITKSALDMNKYAGVAVEDTVKSFAKMQGKPVEALSELALKTGDVNQETIKHVESLVKQGDQAGVTAVAMKALADSNSEVTERLIADSAPIELLWLDIKSAISLASQEVYELATNSSLVDTFRTAWQTVHVIISEVWYVLKTTGNEIGGIAAQLAAVARLDFSAAAAIGRSMKDDAVAGRKAQDAYTKSIIEGNNARSAGAKISNDQRVLNRQAELDRIAKEKKDKETKDKKGAGAKISDEQRAINKAKEEFIDIQNKLNGVNTKFNNQLEGQQLLLSKGLITTEEYAQVVIALTQQQKVYTDEVTKQEKAQRELNKAWDDAVKAQAKKDDDFFKQFDEMTKQRQELEMQTSEIQFQLTLVGKTADEQKVMTREFQLQNKLKNVQVELERELLKIAAEKKDPADVLMFNQEAYRIAAEKIKAINAGVALEFALDMQREFDSIKATITDAVVTALFDGGKAGSKKLRDSIVAAFRNKITVVVDAVVNTALSSGLKALGLGGSSSGGSGGSILNSLSNLSGVIGAGFQALTGSLAGASTASLVGANAVGMVGGDALGALIAANGQWAGVSTVGSAGATGALGSAAGAGSAIASALPYIGLALGAISLLSSAFDNSGTYHTGGTGSYSASKGTGYGANAYSFGMGSSEYNTASNQAAGNLATTIGTLIDSVAVAAGKQAGVFVGTGFADDSSGDGAWGGLNIQYGGSTLTEWGRGADKWPGREFADSDAGQAQYLAAIARDTRAAMEKIGLPKWASNMLSALGSSPTLETLAGAVQQINDTKAALVSLGEVFPQLTNITDKAIEGLITAFGSMGNFAAMMQSYYTNFYTDQEKIARLTDNTSKAFATLGITMPPVNDDMRSWYKGIVEQALALDQGVLANAKATAGILSMQGVVNELAPAFADIADATSSLVSAMLESSKKLQDAINDVRGTQMNPVETVKNQQYEFDRTYALALSTTGETRIGYADELAAILPDLSEAIKATSSSNAEWMARTAAAFGQAQNLANLMGTGTAVASISSVGSAAAPISTATAPGGTSIVFDNSAVVLAVDRLNANIDLLRMEVQADVMHNAKTAKLLDRVIPDGESVQVTVLV